MVAIERKDKVGFVTDSFIRHLLLPGGKVGAESVGEAPSTRPRQDLVSGGPGRDPPTTGAFFRSIATMAAPRTAWWQLLSTTLGDESDQDSPSPSPSPRNFPPAHPNTEMVSGPAYGSMRGKLECADRSTDM